MLHIKFQASEPSCSEEDFWIFSMFFFNSNLGPHLGPMGLGLNKLGKGPPGNATYQISSTWTKQFHFWTHDPEKGDCLEGSKYVKLIERQWSGINTIRSHSPLSKLSVLVILYDKKSVIKKHSPCSLECEILPFLVGVAWNLNLLTYKQNRLG